MNLIEMQQSYLKLYDERKTLEKELADLTRRHAELQERLAEEMKLIGQSSTKIGGRRLTVRVTPRVTKANEVSMETLCEVLENTDMEYLVKAYIHPQSLQAAIKEILEETGEVPAYIKPLVKVWEQIVVAVTNS